MASNSSDPFSNVTLENMVHMISQIRVSQQDGGESSSSSRAGAGGTSNIGETGPVNHVLTNDNDESGNEEVRKHVEKRDLAIATMAMSLEGSQVLQEKLMKQSDDEHYNVYRDMIFQGVVKHMFEVITNQFGNHVFSRLIDHCDHSQKELIVAHLTVKTDMFVQVLCDTHGSSSVKRLIKQLRTSQLVNQITLVLAVQFTTLITNRTASYVILKCFEFLSVEQTTGLYEVLLMYCIDLATDERACIALNDSFKYLKRPYRDPIFQKICRHARFLAQDPSGNYVLQKVLGLQNTTHNLSIFCSLKGCFVDFCTQKASSHVVEKCLECTYMGMSYVLKDFLSYDKLWRIARDQYGNYVIQKALKLAKSVDHPFYPELVKKLYKDKELFQNGFGKNVYAIIMSEGSF